MAWWTLAFTLGVSAVIPALWVQLAQAGNTTCASNQLEWYSSVVGESPCVTYQRLRQICNNDYQVPNFRPNTPGDQCDDQVSACCCNTVAFQLSMLCMNCQYDTIDGDISSGIDAGIGAYTLYRASCGAGVNNSLPTDIQTAVCNENIWLDDFVYGGWSDGSWFYVWTKENAERDHAANNNNTFTHCPNQISPSVTPTPSSTVAIPPSKQTSSPTPTSSPTGSSSTPASSSTSTPASSASALTSTSSFPSNILSSTTETGSSQSHISSDLDNSGPQPTPGLTTNGDTGPNPSQTPAGLTNNGNSNNTSHSKTGTIVGGVIGGVGAIAIAVAGLVFWRIRTHRLIGTPSTQDQHYDYTYHSGSGQDSPEVSSATPFAASLGTEGSTPLWSPGQSSSDPPSTFYSDESAYRHEDGGPVVELVRSASGRLPPAYRSWQTANIGSNGGSASNGDSEVSGAQTASDRPLPVPPSAAVGGAPDPNIPLRISLERDTKEDLG